MRLHKQHEGVFYFNVIKIFLQLQSCTVKLYH